MRRRINWDMVAILISAVFAAAAAGAVEVEVAGPDGLTAALSEAGPGTVIRLAPGEYGSLELRRLRGGPDAPIVLRSADPTNPARLSGLALREVAHVELRDLLFDYTFEAGDEISDRPFQVLSSQDVEILGALFDGDLAEGVSAGSDGFGSAFGLGVRFTTGFTLADSEIRGFYRGLVVSESADVTVTGNDLHGLRMDGMNFAAVQRVLIQANHIHDFDRSMDSGDHADMIQFWTNRTTQPSTDITIRGNVLNSGGGWYTQSIFMRNEEVDTGRAGTEMFYRNLRIEENVILNAHLHGVTVGEVEGLVIANNSVLHNAASEGEDRNPNLWIPQIRVSSGARDVRIERNVVSKVEGYDGQPGWVVDDNLWVQNRRPSEPGYYGQIFSGMPRGDTRDPASFAPRLGGPLDGTGIGASALARIGR